MKRFLAVVLWLFFSTSQLYAQENESTFSVGIALSGPVFGASVTAGLSEKYSTRLIYAGSDFYQGQLHYRSQVQENKSYIFGVGRLFTSTYIRGAVGSSWNKGSWALSAEFGLNVPLDRKTDDEQGLVGAIDTLSYLIFVGAGIHYAF